MANGHSTTRHVLMFPHFRYPCDHAMLETVYSRLLPRRGHRVTWIMEPEHSAASAERAEWNGTPVWLTGPGVATPWFWRLSRPSRKIAQRVALAQRIDSARHVDVVQVRNELSSACAALLLRRRLGVPFVFQLSHPLAHDFRPPDAGLLALGRHHLQNTTRAALQWQVLSRADLVFAISEAMRQQLVRRGLDGQKVKSVPLAVDSDLPADAFDRAAARQELDLGTAPTVLYFGVTDRPRKLDFLLDAVVRVRAALPGVVLLVVGDAANPQDQEWLRREAARRDLGPSVRFVGRVPRERVPFYLAASDVSVAPIPPEPVYVISSPTKVLESLGRGVPVVANEEIPDQQVVVSESGGGACVPYDRDAFAAALKGFLEDPAAARQAGERGREYVVRRRSYAGLADAIEEYYSELLEGWRRGRAATRRASATR